LLATSKVGNSGEYEYATADHLGSPRAWTGPDGNLIAGGRHDYLPFGEELGAGVGIRSASLGYGVDSMRQKFTSKERDSETGLDFFEARYFSSVQGRFTSPDEPFAGQDMDDPQSWNLYTYTLNNPLKYVDPSGKLAIPIVPPILYSPAFIERAINYRNGFGFRSNGQVRAETERRRAFLREEAKNQPLGSLITQNAQGQYHRVDIDNLDPRAVWTYYDQIQNGAVEQVQLGDDQIKALRDLLDNVQVPGIEYKKPKPGLSGKEGAKNIPSWAQGQRPQVGETGDQFARRLLNEKYGPGNWKPGPTSEYSKLKKYAERAFE
jgi:RHS repeat-associated protein